MHKNSSVTFTLFLISCLLPNLSVVAETQDAASLLRENFDYMRGKTSVSTVEMTVHRPEWERVSVIKAWTRGEKDSLITIISPPKDRGNGTLKLGRNMWIFNPKVNRVIKLPPSMMSQSWMGSDFSNNDLAKSDSIITDYNHRIIGIETSEEKTTALIHRRIPVVEIEKFKFTIQKYSLTIEMPEESFYVEGIQIAKRGIAMDVQKLLPELTEINFVESFRSEPKPEAEHEQKPAHKKTPKAKPKKKAEATPKPKAKAKSTTKSKTA